MQALEQIVNEINGWLWGPPLLLILFGTHLFLTVRLGFIQKKLGHALRITFSKGSGEGDVSHFGALMTALAATIGTGNIVGVATAVSMGGPGAVLWMWLTGVFGIATKYAEAFLSVKYRVKNDKGQMAGGPMYVLERALGLKWVGMLFAFFTAVAGLGIGNMVQANSIAGLLKENFSISPMVSGIVLAILTASVILGGIKSIAKVCEMLVPGMALFYIIGCIVLLVMGASTLLDTIKLIFSSAFTGHAVLGGFMGAGVREAIRFGIARGLFSNESGLGSAPIAAAAARTENPVEQALVSATGTFWDTVVICALSGLVIVNSGAWHEGFTGAALTQEVFKALPGSTHFFLPIALFTFVFSTILGWSYYGEKAAEYLWGSGVVFPYRILWVIAVFAGSVMSLPLVWGIADMMNALMALPNLLSLWLLSGLVARETAAYYKK